MDRKGDYVEKYASLALANNRIMVELRTFQLTLLPGHFGTLSVSVLRSALVNDF